MTKPYNVHDRFFKETLSHAEVARDFLINYLPERVLKHLDLSSLKISKDSFVKKGEEHYSDLLYRVNLFGGRKGYVYLLFEHKSYPDLYVCFQLLRYMIDIWELHRKQHPGDEKLPLIIPIVVYHGSVPQLFFTPSELVDIPSDDLRVYVPDYQAEFYDFSPRSELKIKGEIILQLILYCLRAKNQPEVLDHVANIILLLSKLDYSAPAIEWVKVIFRYILDVMDINAEELYNLTTSLPEPTKEVAMSLAEKIRLKGFEEGRMKGVEEGRMKGVEEGKRKGLVEGKVKVLRRLISKRFGLDILPSHIEARLQNATEEELDVYAERIIEAKTLDEVFGDKSL